MSASTVDFLSHSLPSFSQQQQQQPSSSSSVNPSSSLAISPSDLLWCSLAGTNASSLPSSSSTSSAFLSKMGSSVEQGTTGVSHHHDAGQQQHQIPTSSSYYYLPLNNNNNMNNSNMPDMSLWNDSVFSQMLIPKTHNLPILHHSRVEGDEEQTSLASPTSSSSSSSTASNCYATISYLSPSHDLSSNSSLSLVSSANQCPSHGLNPAPVVSPTMAPTLAAAAAHEPAECCPLSPLSIAAWVGGAATAGYGVPMDAEFNINNNQEDKKNMNNDNNMGDSVAPVAGPCLGRKHTLQQQQQHQKQQRQHQHPLHPLQHAVGDSLAPISPLVYSDSRALLLTTSATSSSSTASSLSPALSLSPPSPSPSPAPLASLDCYPTPPVYALDTSKALGLLAFDDPLLYTTTANNNSNTHGDTRLPQASSSAMDVEMNMNNMQMNMQMVAGYSASNFTNQDAAPQIYPSNGTPNVYNLVSSSFPLQNGGAGSIYHNNHVNLQASDLLGLVDTGSFNHHQQNPPNFTIAPQMIHPQHQQQVAAASPHDDTSSTVSSTPSPVISNSSLFSMSSDSSQQQQQQQDQLDDQSSLITTASVDLHPPTPCPSLASSPAKQSRQRRSSALKAPKALVSSHHPTDLQCHICLNTFTRPYNLKSHMKTHTNERPYECTQCDKTFSRKHDCIRHMRIHNQEKPYQCNCCLKQFARQDALCRHLRLEDDCRSYYRANNLKASMIQTFKKSARKANASC